MKSEGEQIIRMLDARKVNAEVFQLKTESFQFRLFYFSFRQSSSNFVLSGWMNQLTFRGIEFGHWRKKSFINQAYKHTHGDFHVEKFLVTTTIKV